MKGTHRLGVSFTNQPQSQDPLSHKPDRLGEALGQPDPPDLDRDLVHLEEVSPRVLHRGCRRWGCGEGECPTDSERCVVLRPHIEGQRVGGAAGRSDRPPARAGRPEVNRPAAPKEMDQPCLTHTSMPSLWSRSSSPPPGGVSVRPPARLRRRVGGWAERGERREAEAEAEAGRRS